MTIRDLHPEWEHEFAASALELLADEAMAICEMAPEHPQYVRLYQNLMAAFRDGLTIEQRIEAAAKISDDVLDYASFETRELGE